MSQRRSRGAGLGAALLSAPLLSKRCCSAQHARGHLEQLFHPLPARLTNWGDTQRTRRPRLEVSRESVRRDHKRCLKAAQIIIRVRTQRLGDLT
jgi:hypothetical protein